MSGPASWCMSSCSRTVPAGPRVTARAGVRAGAHAVAPGYAGLTLGAADLAEVEARDVLGDVDAAGTEARLFAIPSGGKGPPMPSRRPGDGGPTLRSRARAIGG